MKKLIFILAAGFSIGCGSKTDNALSDYEGFKDRMCKCDNKDCAEGVKKDMDEWEKKMRDDKVKKSDMTEDQKAKRKEISKAMSECRSKFRDTPKMDKPAGEKPAAPAEEKK